MGTEDNQGRQKSDDSQEVNKLIFAVKVLGEDFIRSFWNRDQGDEGGFIRKLLRARLEDEGKIPPKSDED